MKKYKLKKTLTKLLCSKKVNLQRYFMVSSRLIIRFFVYKGTVPGLSRDEKSPEKIFEKSSNPSRGEAV